MDTLHSSPSPLCYANGSYLSRDEIRLDPYDLGFLRGYVIFDVMPVENGKPFLWERHFRRLEDSARALHMELPVSAEEYQEILTKLVGENPFEETSLRTVFSGGPSENGFTPTPGNETFLVLVEALHRPKAETYMNGVKTITLHYERPIPQVKLGNHALAIRDLPRRQAEGAFETIYVNGGTVSEASQSNLFIVKDDTLITTWDNVLWGITQGLVLELAEGLGVRTEKRAMTTEELFSADEVFITGSSKRIVPVVQIDETIIGDGHPGETTKHLIQAFDEYVKEY